MIMYGIELMEIQRCFKIQTAITTCCMMAIILSIFSTDTFADSISSQQRLAILSSKEIQESGLADLLTVKVQKIKDVELVERELLEKVLDEMTVSMMLGAKNLENRITAGGLLKANMLVLLSLENMEDKNSVKIVISSCSNGARLYVGWVSFDQSNLETTSNNLAKIVEETLERFESGVKQIIGISPFISRNLVHDYDHLQAGFANLLDNALSSSPGVAVIEIEEARSIRQEDEFAGIQNINRIVPVFVEGEFRFHDAISKKHTGLNLTIRISDNAGIIKQIENNDLDIDSVAGFLAIDTASGILKLSGSTSVRVLNKEEQFLRLIRKADEFAQLGAWEQSTELREAAVLLRPDSVGQRIMVIEECCKMINCLPQSKNFPLDIFEHNLWRPAFEHLEYMIQNRMINITKALKLFEKCQEKFPPSGKSYKRNFMLKVYPKILTLSTQEPHSNPQEKDVLEWYRLLIYQVICGPFPRGRCPDEDDLHFYLQLHENVLPAEMGPSVEFIHFLQYYAKPEWLVQDQKSHSLEDYLKAEYVAGCPEHFTEQQFLDFIVALKNSQRPLCNYYGRYTILLHEYNIRKKKGETLADLRDETELLIGGLEKHEFKYFLRLGQNERPLLKEAKELLRKIEKSP